VNTHAAELQAVTAADLQRVVGETLKPANRTVIDYLPAATQPGSAGARAEPASRKSPP
jgi:predicted Zn-dependent peptidase